MIPYGKTMISTNGEKNMKIKDMYQQGGQGHVAANTTKSIISSGQLGGWSFIPKFWQNKLLLFIQSWCLELEGKKNTEQCDG